MVPKSLIALCCLGVLLASCSALPEMSLMTTGWKSYDVVKGQPSEKFLSADYYTAESTQSYNFQQLLYLAKIGFGTPAQDATLLFDTGSANLWIFGDQCSVSGCAGKVKFDPAKSSTFQNQGEQLDLDYASAYVNGTLGSDVVTYGEIVVKDNFGVMTNVDPGFAGSHFSGIAGMGATQFGQDYVVTPLTTMVKQGKISNQSFSLHLSRNPAGEGSKIVFGGTNPAYYTGDLKYFNNVGADEGFWAVSMQQITIGGKSVPFYNDILTVIDSGTTIVAFPSSMIGTVEQMVGHVAPDCSNVDQLPELKFTFGNTDFSLVGSDYIVVFDIDGKLQCTLPFVELEGDMMILGVMFMRRYYAHFDLDNNRIGFATNI